MSHLSLERDMDAARLWPLRIPALCVLIPPAFRQRDVSFVRNLWHCWNELQGNSSWVLPVHVSSSGPISSWLGYWSDLYSSIPSWIRDPLALSLVVGTVSLALAIAFLENVSTHGKMERSVSKGVLTLIPVNSMSWNSSCPGCIALEVEDFFGGNYVVWTKLDVGVYGILELFISFFISSMVVIYSIFVYHFIR